MTGIDVRHRKTCPGARMDGKCCTPTYQAHVYDARTGKRIRKTFSTRTAAKLWRQDAIVALRSGALTAPTGVTVAQAGVELIDGMRRGAILDRSGKPYKPATIRSYERALRLRINPALGHRKVDQVTRGEVQQLVERLNGEGLSARTVLNTLDPLRVIARRAVRASERATDPTDGLQLPRARGRRDRVATRQEAARLIDALPEGDRALWATMFYAGLRRGEVRALRWSDVNLSSEPALVHVRRTWDDSDGEVDVKTLAGIRTVPLTGRLRELIVEHGLATRRGGDDLVFGVTATQPFTPSTVRRHALTAWGWKREDCKWISSGTPSPPLEPLTPHEARHCAASYLIEAGLNDLELTATIGHSDPRTTKLIYGHLFPDSTASIAAKLDAYLARVDP